MSYYTAAVDLRSSGTRPIPGENHGNYNLFSRAGRWGIYLL